MGERHVRIEISDFVMRTFVLLNFRSPNFAKKSNFKTFCTEMQKVDYFISLCYTKTQEV